MNKLNKISALALSLLMLACSKPDIEVVEQNNSYSLAPKATYVEMPEKVAFDPSNLVRITSSKVITVGAMLDIKNRDKGLEVELEKIVLELQLKRPLKAEAKVTVTENRELLKEYAGDKTNRKEFPNGLIAAQEFTIPAGVTEHTVALDMVDIKQLTDLSGYLTAYALSLVPGEEEIALSSSSQVLFTALDIEEYDSDPQVPELTIKFTGQTEISARLVRSGGRNSFSPRFIEVEVELSEASPLPIDVSIDLEDDLPASYRGSARYFTPLPAWVISQKNHTIPANTTKHKLLIRLATRSSTEEIQRQDYVRSFRLSPNSHHDKVKVDPSENNYRVIVIRS